MTGNSQDTDIPNQWARGDAIVHAVRPSLHIIGRAAADPGKREMRHLDRLANRLLVDDPRLAATDYLGAHVTSGVRPGPALLFEERSEMALFGGPSDIASEYRSLLLAEDEDIVAVRGHRIAEFEAYCRDVLRLGQSTVLSCKPKNPTEPLSLCCARDSACFRTIVETAKRHNGLTVMPYIGMGNAWVLAAALANRSKTDIRVAAPPPRLARRVNDKIWFAERVRELFGRRSLAPTYASFSPAALAARVAALACRHGRVVIKVPESAGGSGNIVVASANTHKLSLANLRDQLIASLQLLGWRGAFPLLVGIWEQPVLCSPSVQLWIPLPEQGRPIVQGVSEQIVEAASGEFIGARPSGLPAEWQERLAGEAGHFALLLQRLGYFGPCSFDALLVGRAVESAELHWVECNGRWGGVSIPMALAHRLTRDWRAPPSVSIHRLRMGEPAPTFSMFLESVRDRLFRASGGYHGGVVFISGGYGMEGLHFMVLADSATASIEESKIVTAILRDCGNVEPNRE